MKQTSSLFLALVTLSTPLLGSIDFTVTTSERVLDGIKFQQLIFHENGRKITYEQPRGWSHSGNSTSITFTPPNIPQAQASIEQLPLREPQNFDEPTMKTLQEQVLAAVPPNSQKVVIVNTEKNPFMINRHETFEVTVAYEAFGAEFQRSVLFVNLPNTQLRFRVTARKQDFE